MPCYSYSANLPILASNVEAVFNATGGTTFSYDSLYYICEIPISNQIYVYTRPSVNGVETLRVENTEYTIQGTNIVFNSAPSGQVVIRRITNDQRMLTVFSDGAKLSATELNSAFHQLLFLTQEKELSGSTYNNVFTDLNSIPAWSAGSIYQIGSVVTFSGSVYRCLQLTSAGQSPTTHPAKWTLVTASSFNFVNIGGPNPVIFDFENLDPNSTLSWDGTKFVASNGVSTDLTSLTDVQLNNPPFNNDVLKYDSTVFRWVNSSTSFDLFSVPVVTPGRIFQFLNTNVAYSAVGAGVDVGSKLNNFKDSNNRWVIPDPPTVYSIIQSQVPATQSQNPAISDLTDYLQSIENRFANIASNVANPIKVKLLWNLNENRLQTVKSSEVVPVYLDNSATMFWNKPEELYSTDGYYSGGGTLLQYFTLTNATGTYSVSPYFTRVSTPGSVFTSKIECYGVKHFYLSVPECVTSCLSSIPVRENSAFTTLSSLGGSTATTGLASRLTVNSTPSFIDVNSSVTVRHHDFYLAALRDFAFAAMNDRTTVSSGGETAGTFPLPNIEWENANNNVVVKERFVRRRKASLISAEYNTFKDVQFKRLESSETPVSVLWKIPEQIIYYNKAALALAWDKNTGATNIPGIQADGHGSSVVQPTGTNSYRSANVGDLNDLRKHVRFEGWSRPRTTDYGPSSSTNLKANNGTVFKADGVWQDWNFQWVGAYYTDNPFFFGHADIDWMLSDVGTAASGNVSSNNIRLFTAGNPTYVPPIVYSGYDITGGFLNGSTDPDAPLLNNTQGGIWWPWPHRPNDIRIAAGVNPQHADGLVGTHLLNIDANKLFSEASRFVPDPVDEYVFRVVCKAGDTTSSFYQAGVNKLKTSIILEHGFASNSRFSSNNILADTAAGLDSIFQNNITTAQSNYVKTRVDYSKIKVYVKNEAIERIGVSPNQKDRLVVTIGVIVPRVKSIGYARIFRKTAPNHFTTLPRARDLIGTGSVADSELDYGPWNWDLTMYSFDEFTLASGSSTAYAELPISSHNTGTSNGLTDWYNFTGYPLQFKEIYMGSPSGQITGVVTKVHQQFDKIATKPVFTKHTKTTSTANSNNWTTNSGSAVSGRNECAVKFVNVGLPSDLWIRLSILSTDGMLNLIQDGGLAASQGINSTATSET